MPTPELIDRVRELHERVEADPNRALETLRPQLKQIVSEPHDAAHYHSLGERLQAAYEALEVDHPKLAAVVQATMNALNAAGL